jgi:hypothetical protein
MITSVTANPQSESFHVAVNLNLSRCSSSLCFCARVGAPDCGRADDRVQPVGGSATIHINANPRHNSPAAILLLWS